MGEVQDPNRGNLVNCRAYAGNGWTRPSIE